MEWLFFVTHPASLATGLPFLTKVNQLFVPPLLIVAVVALAWVALAAVVAALGAGRFLLWIPVAVVVTASLLLLVDNFTITLFGWGSSRSTGLWRAAYGLGLAAAFIAAWAAYVIFGDEPPFDAVGRRVPAVAASLLVVSFVVAAIVGLTRKPEAGVEKGAPALTGAPDILLVSADGLEAGAMSVYGADRNTTPFLDGIRDELVVFENAFTNSNKTAGSLPSVLTGRYPLTTRKTLPSDIFRRGDGRRHLPGILKSRGYRTVQVGNSVNVNAYSWNMRDAFDRRNRTPAATKVLWKISSLAPGRFDLETYAAQCVVDRILERVLHVLYVRESEGSINAPKFHDAAKMSLVEKLIAESRPPLFLALHLERTHERIVFYRPMSDRESRARYEAAVADVDRMLERIVAALKRAGRYDNAVIVFYSDHGAHYRVDRRLPLIMKFPDGRRPPPTAANVQMLDIAPTLLEYLSLPVPSWMEGRSLFYPVDPLRPIVALTAGYGRPGIPVEGGQPPFKGPQKVHVAVCQEFFTFDLHGRTMSRSRVRGHTAPCEPTRLPDERAIEDLVMSHLATRGFVLDRMKPRN